MFNKVTKGEHMKDINAQTATPEDLAEFLAAYVNSRSRLEYKRVAEALTTRQHRTLQQQVFGLFLECLSKWSVANFDERNRWTVEQSEKIVDAVDGMTPPLI